LKTYRIEHADIVNGGELVFKMASEPSDWGKDVPPPTIK
jgi:putative alpha-1,2-mannosidase